MSRRTRIELVSQVSYGAKALMSTSLPTQRRPARSTRRAPAAAAPEPDLQAAMQRVLELMAIPGGSGHEGAVAEAITRHLRQAGAPASAITSDDAHRRTPIGGEVGNLVLQLPGTQSGPHRLLMAHMDTVPL